MAKSFFTKRSGNIHKISHDALHNQYVLYFVFFVAVGNLFLFVFSNDLMSAGVFFTAGLLTSFFSKNMVVILVTAMVVSNIIRMGISNKREGFEENDDEEEEKEGFQDEDEEDDDNFKGEDDDDDDDDNKEGFGKRKKTNCKIPKKCTDSDENAVECNSYSPNPDVDNY
jgi:hypothetical protein